MREFIWKRCDRVAVHAKVHIGMSRLSISFLVANVGEMTLAAVAGHEAANSGCAAPWCYASVLHCPGPLAPSLLPLKRACSLCRTETVIPNPKFGEDIIHIYI